MAKGSKGMEKNLKGLHDQVREALDIIIDFTDPDLAEGVFESKHGDLVYPQVIQISKIALNALDKFIQCKKRKSYFSKETKNKIVDGKIPTEICPNCGHDLFVSISETIPIQDQIFEEN
jgi:hypothetical protein